MIAADGARDISAKQNPGRSGDCPSRLILYLSSRATVVHATGNTATAYTYSLQ